jgi:hypothetical protein
MRPPISARPGFAPLWRATPTFGRTAASRARTPRRALRLAREEVRSHSALVHHVAQHVERIQARPSRHDGSCLVVPGSAKSLQNLWVPRYRRDAGPAVLHAGVARGKGGRRRWHGQTISGRGVRAAKVESTLLIAGMVDGQPMTCPCGWPGGTLITERRPRRRSIMVPGGRTHSGANRYIPSSRRWRITLAAGGWLVESMPSDEHQGRPPRKSQAEFARSRLLFGLRVALPPRPPDWRLLSGSCASDRGVASGFLPTTPRGAAVAVRRGVPHTKVPRGLAPPSHAPCLAHNARPRWQCHRGLIGKPWSRPLNV